MAVDTPEFIDSALLVYHAEVRKGITAQESRLEQLQDAHDQLQETINCVQQLPSKLRHQIMVPYGKHAFFPGHLTRTNELTVHLGDQYYVKTTAGKAQGILQRKLAVLAQGISKGQQQLQSLQARLVVTNSSLRDGSASEPAFEIRSSVEESDALLASVKKSSAAGRAAARQQRSAAAQTADDVAYEALQSRLEELIKLEAQMEAEEELRQWTDRQQLQHGLTSIAEGDEGSADWQPESRALLPQPDVTSMTSRVQQLQLLEAEPDSDDEQQQPQQQQQQQQQKQQQKQKQPQQERQQRSSPSAEAGSRHARSGTSAAVASRGKTGATLKPALKKGFFNSPLAASSALGGTPVVTTSASMSKPSYSLHEAGGSSSSSSGAFTGMIMERSATEQPPGAPETALGLLLSDVQERQPVPSASGGPVVSSAGTGQFGNTSATSNSTRPSKFKLQRMGL